MCHAPGRPRPGQSLPLRGRTGGPAAAPRLSPTRRQAAKTPSAGPAGAAVCCTGAARGRARLTRLLRKSQHALRAMGKALGRELHAQHAGQRRAVARQQVIVHRGGCGATGSPGAAVSNFLAWGSVQPGCLHCCPASTRSVQANSTASGTSRDFPDHDLLVGRPHHHVPQPVDQHAVPCAFVEHPELAGPVDHVGVVNDVPAAEPRAG